VSTPTNQSALPVLSYDDAPAESKVLLDKLKAAVGRIPNLYAAQAHSPIGLGAKLNLDGELSKGIFSGLPKEVIALAVAEVNGCDYCLAAHTAIAKMRGASEVETLNFRRGMSEDEKLSALAALSREIVETHGYPSQATLERFFAVGYDHAALVELLGLVALNIWNNYTNHIAQTPVDFPAVPNL
jgi:AhpD family alkylhydroperoxidase